MNPTIILLTLGALLMLIGGTGALVYGRHSKTSPFIWLMSPVQRRRYRWAVRLARLGVLAVGTAAVLWMAEHHWEGMSVFVAIIATLALVAMANFYYDVAHHEVAARMYGCTDGQLDRMLRNYVAQSGEESEIDAYLVDVKKHKELEIWTPHGVRRLFPQTGDPWGLLAQVGKTFPRGIKRIRVTRSAELGRHVAEVNPRNNTVL